MEINEMGLCGLNSGVVLILGWS